ncbi:low temperature requirement protein A [Streptococcus oricebi]|uniref:Low temperature requirement protein A n=1 Tax=Streptococcus oricebi TaxID=1547447 RepID=A0ABS5B3E9_9STRE|nr:low temperature requirement protein A [Streptococcus oricebi]MBP2623196.1 low temperature requirement protein A [Streptococcus oricebi]
MPQIIAKRVSNYELFYDLVFVLAISKLTSLLHQPHFQLQNFLVYLSAFVGILSVWFFQTIYINKYAHIDRNDVYGIIALMFIVGQMAINMTNTPSTAILLLYQVLYASAYGVILVLYLLRRRRYGTESDMAYNLKILSTIVIFHLLMALLTLIGLLKVSHIIFFFPFLPLFLVSLTRPKQQAPVNFPHLVERCQLITIISFGETVIALVSNYPLDKFPAESLIFFLGMAFLFVIYISQTYLNMDHHQEAQASRLIFSHISLIMGLNLFTIAVELFPHHLNSVSLTYFLAGLSIFYLSLLSNSSYNKEEFQISKSQLAAYLLLLALALVLIWLVRKYLLAIALIFLILSYSMAHVGYVYRQAARRRQAKSN